MNIERNFASPKTVALPELLRGNELAERLFARTLEHPEWRGLIAWAPTDWVVPLANPEPLESTNTAGADGLPDRCVDLETLFQGMVENGMRDPLVLGIGLNGHIRLETGNQRVRCFLKYRVELVPIVGYVNDTAVTHLENGQHRGMPLDVDYSLLATRYRQYVQPADALTAAPVFI